MVEPNLLRARIEESFARQRYMATLGAALGAVEDGEVEILLPLDERVMQQHGYAHAGAIASVADSACGYACLTKMPAGSAVLSIEFKINMLAPAVGDSLAAKGRVVRAGKQISVATAEVFARSQGAGERLVAIMQATMMRVEPVDGLAG